MRRDPVVQVWCQVSADRVLGETIRTWCGYLGVQDGESPPYCQGRGCPTVGRGMAIEGPEKHAHNLTWILFYLLQETRWWDLEVELLKWIKDNYRISPWYEGEVTGFILCPVYYVMVREVQFPPSLASLTTISRPTHPGGTVSEGGTWREGQEGHCLLHWLKILFWQVLYTFLSLQKAGFSRVCNTYCAFLMLKESV